MFSKLESTANKDEKSSKVGLVERLTFSLLDTGTPAEVPKVSSSPIGAREQS